MPYVEYDEVEATCSDCGRMFRSEEALESHRTEVHQPVERPASRSSLKPESDSTSRCAVCRIDMDSREKLRQHMRTAHPASPSETAAL
jgi:hypothetical protein